MKKINENRKALIIGVVSLVIGIVLGYFIGGMLSGKNASQNAGNNFGSRAQGGFSQMTGKNGTQSNRQFGGGVSGEIISLSENNMVIKSRDGGSRIVLLSGSSEVSKNVFGSTTDLVVGNQVMITGAANPDGSINASMIQIRPSTSTLPSR